VSNPSLFDPVDPRFYARNTDPDTSHEAAERLSRAELEAMWRKVLHLLDTRDRPEGWTWHEIAAELPGQLGECPWHRVGDCRSKDKKYADWAYDEEGKKIKRPGPSNRKCGASRITDKGRRWLRGEAT
jgi:hypothetical protein